MKNSGFRLTQALLPARTTLCLSRTLPFLRTLQLPLRFVCLFAWAASASIALAQSAETAQDRLSDGIEQVDGIQRSLEGPDVVITAGKDRTVFEYRQNGQLRMVKIVPALGRPYYLVPADQTRGFGDLNQADMLLPNWVIVEF